MKTSTKISTHRLILPLTTFYSGQERKARKRAPAFSKVMNSVCNDIWHIVYIVAFSIVFQSCAEEATLSLSEQDVPLGKVVLEEGQVNAKMNLNRTVSELQIDCKKFNKP